MREWTVEIADEVDGFIVVEAETADEAEYKAYMLGYDVMYAHDPDEL